MKSAIPIIAIAACFFSTAGCHSQSKQFTEKKLVIASKQTVEVKELDLSITNNGCGRKWIVNENEQSYEVPYCDLVIKRKDTIVHIGGDRKPIYSGDIEMRLVRINPWGAWEDSVPPGGCRIWIRRSPAFVLLEKYGWSPEKMIAESEITLPDTIRGIPFVQYESAALATGFHLSTLAGQTLPILKIQLKEKGSRSGTNLWAHIVMDGDEAVTGWLSSQVMVPGGPAPLNLSKDKLGNW